ncbi:MAG TPA: hypothetical protein VGL38_06315 [bacterium]|jgi:hypothetical protein
MVRWFAGIATLLLLLTVTASAQPFSATWIYISDGGNAALTTACPPQGTTPIPDGRIVKIFWDSNNNGPDLVDPQPQVCIDPPDCIDGPPGSVNYNQFQMNGTAGGYGAGYFVTDNPNFASSGVTPDPSRYYLRIYQPDGVTVLWTSRAFTITTGAQEIWMQQSDWTCGTGPQCVVRDEHE